MMRAAPFVALLGLLAPLPAAAHPLDGTAAAAPEQPDGATRLAEQMFGDAQMLPLLKSVWEGEVRSRPELLAIQAKDPGFNDYLWSRLEPEFRLILTRELPVVRRKAAALFAGYMTDSEMAAVADFYRTGLGLRIQALNANLFTLPRAERDAAFEAGMREIIRTATPADNRAAATIAGISPKLDAAGAAMNAVLGQYMTNVMKAEEPHLRTVALAAGREYAAAHGMKTQ